MIFSYNSFVAEFGKWKNFSVQIPTSGLMHYRDLGRLHHQDLHENCAMHSDIYPVLFLNNKQDQKSTAVSGIYLLTNEEHNAACTITNRGYENKPKRFSYINS